jgi:spermidine/putrescine transport system ATP-binding protein
MMQDDNIAIELSGVTKRYDEVVAVNDFSVAIRKGEFFSLLGPSGCGKTTTLRLIAGLEKPSEGKIFLEDRDVTTVQAYRRNVNTVFQDYALFPHMNVMKNIYFPLKMRNIPLEQAAPRIQRVLKLVSMEGFDRRLPQQLSGGQRQRIALARSLVNEPAALLLDEPLGALDFKLRLAMQKVLKDIQRNVGITFVYVTHDQTEAMTMSDRIAVMKDGVVHQIGSPDEIYNTPATAFVASFIGDMNFLSGTLKKAADGESEVLLAEHTIRTCHRHKKIDENGEVLLGVRSEKVAVNPPAGAVENSVPARITRIVFRGVDYEITSVFHDQEIRSVVSATAWDRYLKEGDEVTVGWDADNCLVYSGDEETDVIKY